MWFVQHAGRKYEASILGVHTCPTPSEQHSKLVRKRESHNEYHLWKSFIWVLENGNNITVQANYYIFIATKHYIFQTKQNKETPNCNNFKNKLEQKIFIEKQIAQNRDKLEIHNRKWRPFLDHMWHI